MNTPFLLHQSFLLSCLLLIVAISGCGLFSNEKYAANLDGNVHFSLEYEAAEGELEFRQIIHFSNEANSTTLDDDTRTKDLEIHLDSLPINAVQTPMFFIYNLYLGWAVLDYETLEIHKGFSEIPKEQALLTKLRLMENPIWKLDLGEE